MKKDIATREDLEKLLVEFYRIIIHDPEVGHHFDELDLEYHLPIITDFWEKALFGNPVYFGNPMAVHQKLHERFPLQPEHFRRWVEIFSRTVDSLFEGEMAEAAKSRAQAIAAGLNDRLNGGIKITKTV